MRTQFVLRMTLVVFLSASVALLIVVTSDISMTSLPPVWDNVSDTLSSSCTNDLNMLWFRHSAPFQQFEEDEPKSVIILTYQRSGSSFFGQMFNSNPSSFYMFEPLDALYSALYGTSPGWNVPSDITSFWNGSQRLLPKTEIAAVASFLRSVYTCDVDALPTECLAHRYWTKFGGDHANSIDYVKCLRERNLTLVACYNHTVQHCGKRFGEKSPTRLAECNRLLWSESRRTRYAKVETRRRFEQYHICSAHVRTEIEKRCVSLLRSDCNRPLRAVKTVRATMDSMEPLLRTLPNFRVIHLIRDPRAVALSRIEFDTSARGQFTNKAGAQKIVTEASLYCRAVAHDLVSRRRLMRQYPNRIYPLMYDDVVRDLNGYTRKVYRFLNEQVPGKIVKWIGNNARRKRNGTTIANRWQDSLTVHQNEQILSVCSEFFKLLRQTPDME